MLVPSDKAREFQGILREEYGKELTEGEAGVLLSRLLLLYERIYKRHPNEEANSPSVGQNSPAPH